MDNNKKLFEGLLKADGINPAGATESEHIAFVKMLDEQSKSKQSKPVSRLGIWRIIMKSKITKFAAAAMFIIVVLGGINFWPDNKESGKWWLGLPAAWGQEIIAELEKVEALVFREQFVFVGKYGSTHVSGNWSRCYEAKDRFRRDTFYEPTDEDTYFDNSEASVLQDVTLKVPEGRDLIQYLVSWEFECYTIERLEGQAYERDPIERLEFYVNLLEKANQILDTEIFEDRECVGFEISASKYGNNPAERIDRIWFDVETKLPVRIEKQGKRITNRMGETYTIIEDQFEYYVELPPEMFEPDIPDGFVNAKPGEMRAAREKEIKGEMLFANVDVPKTLKVNIGAALEKVKTVSYQDGSTQVYLSENVWRKDYYSGDNLIETKWFVIDRSDSGKSFDFKNFKLTETIVNFNEQTYRVITYDSTSHPRNPMDGILFLAGIVDRADRVLENTEIEGLECIGFEISAKKYGTNPDDMIHRLWFDEKTKLPVRIVFEHGQRDGIKKLRVRDQFQWDIELAKEIFKPIIPEGFALIGENNK